MKLIKTLSVFSFGLCVTIPSLAVLPDRTSVNNTISLVDNYWINGHSSNTGNNDWANSVYHNGNVAAYATTGNAAFLAYSNQHATNLNWKINNGAITTDADMQTLGQVYFGLTSDATKLANTKLQTDSSYDNNQYDKWTWIDAIFMQMNVFTKMGNQYGNVTRNYHSQMNKMFNYTQVNLGLYDTIAPVSHLWYRDGNYKYPSHQSPNGKKILWSRGNGWVFASLATTLDTLPASDANYSKYQTIFQDMAGSLLTRQRSDGFWNSNLDDPNDFGGPETTGTSAFTYGMALGIRKGILSSATYFPAVEKAWKGLTSTAVQSNGFLGYCQQVGLAPGATNVKTTTDFGVGLFLLAGSEVSKLAPTTVTNLALNKSVTYSSQIVGNEATLAVDGNTGTYWSAQTYPQWILVDLGSVQAISKTQIYPNSSRAYQYKIEASPTGAVFTTLVSKPRNKTGGTVFVDSFTSFNARYVKLTITGASGYSGGVVSINELMVNP